MNTKFSKTFTTYFFPVGEDIRNIVEDWATYLRQEKLWGNDDPLFPATKIVVGPAHHFQATGLKPEHWRTAAPIRAIFRKSFTAAGLRYFNPHSVRNTLVSLGEAQCQTPEQFKAWSRNLGHEGVLTTFTCYGAVGNNRQREIIGNLGSGPIHNSRRLKRSPRLSRFSAVPDEARMWPTGQSRVPLFGFIPNGCVATLGGRPAGSLEKWQHIPD